MARSEKKVLIVGASGDTGNIGYVLGRLGIVSEILSDAGQLAKRAKAREVIAVILDRDSALLKDGARYEEMARAARASGKGFITVSSDTGRAAITGAKEAGSTDYILRPFNQREFVTRFGAAVNRNTKIACIGGGTGLFNVLMALKGVYGVLPISIVSMSDSGGSSGRLKVSFGILPPGDVRRSLIALSSAPEIMNDLMQYRFVKGDGLSGHSLGNLFLTALSDIEGSMSQAVRRLGDILSIQGIVIPVTETQNTLCARFEDGSVISGEDKIDLAEGRDWSLRIKELWHEPEVSCSPAAYAALIFSDIIVIGPGDLFTSVVTNLIIDGISEAVSKSGAKKAYICNLMTKPGETAGFGAADHLRAIVDSLGADALDYVIISNTGISEIASARYKEKGQIPIAIPDLRTLRSMTSADLIVADIGDERELVRHDKEKLKNVLRPIIEEVSRA